MLSNSTEVIRLAGIFAVVGLLSQAPVVAGERSGSITVHGDAEVLVAPDEVVLTLGVETLDDDLHESKKQNDDRVKRILSVVTEGGIDPAHVQTEHIGIEPLYKNEYRRESFVGYRCRKTIVVKLKDVSKFEEVLTAALESGANYVHGVQFRTTELRKHRDRARALAIRAAREKAGDMARELGQEIGAPESIQEGSSRWSAWYGSSWWGSGRYSPSSQNAVANMGGGMPLADGVFAPGQVSITAQVTVTFGLMSGGQ